MSILYEQRLEYSIEKINYIPTKTMAAVDFPYWPGQSRADCRSVEPGQIQVAMDEALFFAGINVGLLRLDCGIGPNDHAARLSE